MGVSIAVSFIPVVGPLISCIIDGTFVDMLTAISKGDWAMLGMCAMAFVPGAKVMKGLKAVGGGLGKATKVIKPYKTLAKELKGTGKQAHHLVEARFAKKLGVDPNTMPSVAVGKGAEHQLLTNRGRQAISHGKGTASATLDDIVAQQYVVYQDDPELLHAALDYLSGFM